MRSCVRKLPSYTTGLFKDFFLSPVFLFSSGIWSGAQNGTKCYVLALNTFAFLATFVPFLITMFIHCQGSIRGEHGERVGLITGKDHSGVGCACQGREPQGQQHSGLHNFGKIRQ
jgi:hypothetical protein